MGRFFGDVIRFRGLLGGRLMGLMLSVALLVAMPAASARAEQVVPRVRVARRDTAVRSIMHVSRAAEFRKPSATRYAALRARKDLQYRPPNYRPALSFWDRFWSRIWHAIDWLFNRPGTGVAFRWIWYAFLLSVVVWIVVKALKLDVVAAFGRSPRSAPKFELEDVESPFTDDLADRLAEAEAAGNYRLAVRLGYLTSLRTLADREMVRWLPDKTNIQYVRELPVGALREQFARLTRQFEVAWYGELYPTADDYATVRETRAAVARALGAASSFSAPAAAAASSAR